MPQCPRAGDTTGQVTAMGVDHGGVSEVNKFLHPEFGVKDGKANCLPPILSYRYKRERSVAFKILQNPFSAGALTRTPLGRSSCTMHPRIP